MTEDCFHCITPLHIRISAIVPMYGAELVIRDLIVLQNKIIRISMVFHQEQILRDRM